MPIESVTSYSEEGWERRGSLTREFQVALGLDEVMSRTQVLLDDLQQLDDMGKALAQARADYATKRKEIQERVTETRLELRARARPVKRECAVWMNFPANVVHVVDPSTNTVVEERAITADERQQVLGGDPADPDVLFADPGPAPEDAGLQAGDVEPVIEEDLEKNAALRELWADRTETVDVGDVFYALSDILDSRGQVVAVKDDRLVVVSVDDDGAPRMQRQEAGEAPVGAPSLVAPAAVRAYADLTDEDRAAIAGAREAEEKLGAEVSAPRRRGPKATLPPEAGDTKPARRGPQCRRV